MAEADLILWLGGSLSVGEWRTLAGRLSERVGIRTVEPVAPGDREPVSGR